MIVELPDTSTREVNRTLVRIREEGGAVALGRVLNLVIDADGGDPEEAIAAANDASRERGHRVPALGPARGPWRHARDPAPALRRTDRLVVAVRAAEGPRAQRHRGDVGPSDHGHDPLPATCRRTEHSPGVAYPRRHRPGLDQAHPVAWPAGGVARPAAVRARSLDHRHRRTHAPLAQPARRLARADAQGTGPGDPRGWRRGHHRSAARTGFRTHRAQPPGRQEGDAHAARTCLLYTSDAAPAAPRVSERGVASPRRRRGLRRGPDQRTRPDRPGLSACAASSSTQMPASSPRPWRSAT